jgi:formylglycine-generating enzyme required for sulfatase activity
VTLEVLLLAVHTSVRRLGVQDHLLVERWLRSAPSDAAGFRAGFASVLAQDRAQWDAISHLVDLYLQDRLLPDGRVADGSSAPSRAEGALREESAAEAAARRREGLVDRLLGWVGRQRSLTLVRLAGAAVLLLSVALVVFAAWPEPSESIPTEVVVTEVRPPPDPSVPRAALEPRVVPAAGVRRIVTPFTPSLAWERLVVVALAAWAMLMASGRLRALEGPAARQRREQQEEDRSAAAQLRERLEQDRAARGAPVRSLYHPRLFPALDERAVQDAAARLGRIRRWSGGVELDVGGTVARTVDAGGQVTPVWHDRAIAEPVLVLVERGGGSDHPWLARFRRLVTRLGRLGVPLEVWEFARTPDELVDAVGRRLNLAGLARRSGGRPLLVLSASLTPAHLGPGEAPWVASLAAWPRAAWLDPDVILEPRRAAVVRRLGQLGLPRFPFTEPGLVAAAGWLAGGRRVAVADPVPTGDVELALQRWVMAAALVPEPGWDQLEELRRIVPAVSRVFTGPWGVSWMLREARRQSKVELSDDGSLLAMVDGWVQECRERFHRAPDAELQAMWVDVHEALLRQLGTKAPEGEIERSVWQLKVALLRVGLEPGRADELLLPLVRPDNPVRDLVLEAIGDLLRRQAVAPSPLGPLGLVVREHLETVQTVEAWVGWRALVRGVPEAWPGWRRALGWAGVLGVGIVLAGQIAVEREGATGILPEDWRVEPPAEPRPSKVEVVAVPVEPKPPPDLELTMVLSPGGGGDLPPANREPAPALRFPPGTLRPPMVRLAGGSFNMYGAINNPTTVSRFEIGQTEVTQAMYRAVMGEGPARSCPEYEGVSLLGDDLPVLCVTWDEAVAYCNRLSERSGLKPAYRQEGGTWVVDLKAEGYRLPTEAEWELAARAGGSTRFVGTDEEDAVCDHDNVGDASFRAKFGYSIFPFNCNDHRVGPTEVSSYLPNAFRLYDMGGNVYEWTTDWTEHPKAPPGGLDPVSRAGFGRVVRGGWWDVFPDEARVSWPSHWHPFYSDERLGFRPARSLSPSSPLAIEPSAPGAGPAPASEAAGAEPGGGASSPQDLPLAPGGGASGAPPSEPFTPPTPEEGPP